ncbi:MAG: hypothetical protein RLZZ299_2868 [Pseudomonadota bacterium]|jgi:hypothetical protein
MVRPEPPDPREELAALTADLLAILDSWQRTGARVVAVGAVEGLGEAPAGLLMGRGDIPPQRPPGRGEGPASASPPTRVEGPAGVVPTSPRTASPAAPTPVAPVVASVPAGSAPPAPAESVAPAPATPSGGGLFGGRWAAVRDPDAALRAARDEGPDTCETCGAPPPRGVGRARATVAVIASPLAGEAAVMFDRMLVHVLVLERADVFLVAPSDCGTCAARVRKQVEAVAPRAVLAMGEGACALVGAAPGRWSSWAGREALGTHHPDTLLARADLKRAVFDHLKELARRVG